MSLVNLLASVSTFVRIRFQDTVIDNSVYRLHYQLTAGFFFLSCVLVTAFDFIGNPIDCITDEGPSDKDQWQQVINTYCWIQHTFTVTTNYSTPYPGVGMESPGDTKTVHNYYQWVPFVLFLQGVLFCAPHWIWKQYARAKLISLTDGMRGFRLGDGEQRRKKCAIVSAYLHETIDTNGGFAVVYVLCELLNFVNSLGHIYFIDRFLSGVFLKFGIRVLQFSDTDQENRSDPMIEVFPRVTKCTFLKYGPSGGLQKHDAQCILPLNILHEKLYVFVWFWLVFLTAVTSVSVVVLLSSIISSKLRRLVLSKTAMVDGESTRIVVDRLPFGDCLLLYFLGKNLEGFLFKELVDDLTKRLLVDGAEKQPIFVKHLNSETM